MEMCIKKRFNLKNNANVACLVKLLTNMEFSPE